MLLLKTSGKTIGEVIRRAKHATNTRPDAQLGDIILIAQTKRTLKPSQKSIRYIMTYKGYRLDTKDESQRIWGKKWKYMIDGADVIKISGFDIKDLQVSDNNYDYVQTHKRLRQDDEEAVLAYLSRRSVYERARPMVEKQTRNRDEILQELGMISSRGSDATIAKSKRYYRDPRKSALLKELYNHKCQVCETVINDAKGRPYIETHHIVGRARNGKDDPSNMLVVCPNHHKMFSLGSAKIDLETKTVYINGQKAGWINKHL